jgi:hypothetical protein
MNFAAFFKALDAVVLFREVTKRFTAPAETPSRQETSLERTVADDTLVGHLETRLTNVVVAALKEAFARDHARLELERAQLDEQRKRAEEAMHLELRRQAADREVGRLRLVAGTAMVGWIASVVLLVARLGEVSGIARGTIAAAWLLLLGALGAAFTAQGKVSAYAVDTRQPVDAGSAGAAALWLLIAGLAAAAGSLLV